MRCGRAPCVRGCYRHIYPVSYTHLDVYKRQVEEHSKKPDITREKIVELAGDLPRAELFARQKTPGWDAWGNEVDSDFFLSVPETR